MPLLEITDLRAGYGDVPVLHGVDLNVGAAEVVSLIGANGAGKTTLLRALSGIITSTGGIHFDGQAIAGKASDRIVAAGIAHVPEGRQLFGAMTVEENLRLGAPPRLAASEIQRRLQSIFALFPRLEQRRTQLAETLSGGEQQMVAIGRGLALGPRLLVLDEPSLGLAPLMVQAIFGAIRQLASTGMSILLVEQNVVESLRCSSRAYVLETGRITLSGSSHPLMEDSRVRAAFLGGSIPLSHPHPQES
jgi:branched-chain amino acid transport system ATP-binding protein